MHSNALTSREHEGYANRVHGAEMQKNELSFRGSDSAEERALRRAMQQASGTQAQDLARLTAGLSGAQFKTIGDNIFDTQTGDIINPGGLMPVETEGPPGVGGLPGEKIKSMKRFDPMRYPSLLKKYPELSGAAPTTAPAPQQPMTTAQPQGPMSISPFLKNLNMRFNDY